MVVVDDAAIGAYGHVDAGLLVIAVALGAHVDQRAGLAAADALLLAGDADGAAADADLDEIRAALGQEAEALSVDHVAGADLDALAVVFADPCDGAFLPLGVALGGVNAQHVGPGLEKGGDALGIVAGVDAGADHVFLVGVEQLQRVLLVHVVVLAEHHVHETAFGVHDGQGVELVIPDDVVGLTQGGAGGSGDQLFDRCHEGADLLLAGHAADAVIAAGDDAHQASGGGAVLGDGHGGMAGLLLQGQDVRQSVVRTEVGVADHETGLVRLDPGHHGGLLLDGLGAVDEAHAALLGEGHGHLVVGNSLHDG